MSKEKLSERAQNLRDNWDDFDADGLTKIMIGVDRIYEAAKREDWESAVDQFDWLCKKVAIADVYIREYEGEEEDDEE